MYLWLHCELHSSFVILLLHRCNKTLANICMQCQWQPVGNCCTYRIASNIDGKLNLVDWQYWKQTAKSKSANIHVQSINCIVHVCKDGSKIYHASLLQKKLPFGLSIKGPISYRWRTPICEQKCRKCIFVSNKSVMLFDQSINNYPSTALVYILLVALLQMAKTGIKVGKTLK